MCMYKKNENFDDGDDVINSVTRSIDEKKVYKEYKQSLKYK